MQSVDFYGDAKKVFDNLKCSWIFRKQISTNDYLYTVGCNKKKFSDLHEFIYCPYCGRELKYN